MLVFIESGCAPNGQEARNASPVASVTMPGRTPASSPAGVDSQTYKLIIRIRTTSIELPVGASSDSEEIWSYLDEEFIAAGRSGALGRNGLRVGLGRTADLTDLTQALKDLGGREIAYNTITVIPGLPAAMIIKRQQPEATIFIYNGDGSVSGADYPPGDFLLGFSCGLNEDDPAKIIITIVPQIRASAMETRLKDANGEVGFEITQDLFSLDAVRFQLVAAVNDLIVIGPGQRSQRNNNLARYFLITRKDGMEYEVVMIMIPEVVAVPVR